MKDLNAEKVLFFNRTKYDFSTYLYMKLLTLPRGFMATALVFFAGFVALTVYAYKYYSLPFGIILNLMSVYLFFRTLIPIRLALRSIRADKAAQDGKLVETDNFFFEDYILAVNKITSARTKIRYSDIKFIHVNRKVTVLEMDKKLVLIFRNSNFKDGKFKEALSFISEKFQER